MKISTKLLVVLPLLPPANIALFPDVAAAIYARGAERLVVPQLPEELL